MSTEEIAGTRAGKGTGSLLGLRRSIGTEVARAVIGQHDVLDAIVTALSTTGHLLLEGAPGVAKTLLATAVSRSLGTTFKRVQFTPDMLPTDITGNLILEAGVLRFRPGPLFANLVLADEVNRTPPKTQAALLEAMQERQVTVDGIAHALPEPFLVLATQNPIDYEGTYPLPEAQLDRFLMKVIVEYPSEADEIALLGMDRQGLDPAGLAGMTAVVGREDLASARAEVTSTAMSPEIVSYTASIVRHTRELPAVQLGASPRAGVHLLAASKAAARLAGRSYVVPDDVAAMAVPVLAHRIVLRPEAELDRYRADEAVTMAVSLTPVPR